MDHTGEPRTGCQHGIPESGKRLALNGNQSKVKRLLFVRSDGTQDPSPGQAENFDLFAIKLKTDGSQNDERVEEPRAPYGRPAKAAVPGGEMFA